MCAGNEINKVQSFPWTESVYDWYAAFLNKKTELFQALLGCYYLGYLNQHSKVSEMDQVLILLDEHNEVQLVFKKVK